MRKKKATKKREKSKFGAKPIKGLEGRVQRLKGSSLP